MKDAMAIIYICIAAIKKIIISSKNGIIVSLNLGRSSYNKSIESFKLTLYFLGRKGLIIKLRNFPPLFFSMKKIKAVM